jgi:hypothetical protein
MDRVLPAIIVALVLALFLVLMVVGWRRRVRSQSALPSPVRPPSSLGTELWQGSVLYVATTRGGDRLDRVAVHGLGFRARGELSVHPEGLVLSLRGSDAVFISRESLRGVGLATWAIDRVVEPGGLVVLDWELEGLALDSYLRLSAAQSDSLVAATRSILMTPATPEGDPA